MVLHSTLGINATNVISTRVHTLIIWTCQSNGTVSVIFTLSFAFNKRITKKVWFTFTDTPVSRHPSISITSTRVRNTGISWGFRFFLAIGERITDVACQTLADSIVIFDVAFCVFTTDANTGIFTLFPNTSQRVGTISIDLTFRPAIGWWAEIAFFAHTGCIAILIFAEGISPTWVRITRIFWLQFNWLGYWKRYKSIKIRI